MMQFNEDGSLKLSSSTVKKKQDNIDRMKKYRCMLIKKEMVNFSAPKKCLLHVTLSDVMIDNKFIESVHKYFKSSCDVPTKLIKINEKEFDIEIGTHFKRCSDCTTLVNRYREYMEDSLIIEKGNCTYEPFSSRNFSYEDYFE